MNAGVRIEYLGGHLGVYLSISVDLLYKYCRLSKILMRECYVEEKDVWGMFNVEVMFKSNGGCRNGRLRIGVHSGDSISSENPI